MTESAPESAPEAAMDDRHGPQRIPERERELLREIAPQAPPEVFPMYADDEIDSLDVIISAQEDEEARHGTLGRANLAEMLHKVQAYKHLMAQRDARKAVRNAIARSRE